MINMANAASAQALEEGKKRLREFLEASDTGRRAVAMSTEEDGEAYEMKRMNMTGRGKGMGMGDRDGDGGRVGGSEGEDI